MGLSNKTGSMKVSSKAGGQKCYQSNARVACCELHPFQF
jgi:hypothetical protein